MRRIAALRLKVEWAAERFAQEKRGASPLASRRKGDGKRKGEEGQAMAERCLVNGGFLARGARLQLWQRTRFFSRGRRELKDEW